MKLLFLLIVKLLSVGLVKAKQIRYELNENCGEKCRLWPNRSAINVLHITSDSDSDNYTIHTLMSTLNSVPPTLLMARTQTNTQLTINWTKLIDEKSDVSDAISFSSSALNSMAIEISKLYFFNDLNKTGYYVNGYPILNVNWDEFVWETVNHSIASDGQSLTALFRERKGYEFNNGSIAIQLRVEANDGIDHQLPHLSFTPLSASLQLSVTDVSTNLSPHFADITRDRLMADILAVSEGALNSDNHFDTIVSIDDEYTPGVFKSVIMEMKSRSGDAVQSGYLQWKPIAYDAEERIIANSIDVLHSDLVSNLSLPNSSIILLAYYGSQPYNCANFSLTFGAVDDSTYYSDKKYSVFTMTAGLESPPDQKLSFLVQMIILVGFGLPLLVMIISAVYLLIRKIRKSNYDDLLLSQSTNN